jgi:hypothetical protein
MSSEVDRRGRMTSVYGLELDHLDEYGTVEAAIKDLGASFWAIPETPPGGCAVCVMADMRRLTVAQVALALRRMADHIEDPTGGLAVYQGPGPDAEHPGNWMAIERADGSFDHSIQ